MSLLVFSGQACPPNATGVLPDADNMSGMPAAQGIPGTPGLNCWDLNGNGVGDPNEDVNGDGDFNALDCQGLPGSDGQDGADGQDGQDGLDGASPFALVGNDAVYTQGKVGIGNDAPDALLDVLHTASTESAAEIHTANAANVSPALQVTHDGLGVGVMGLCDAGIGVEGRATQASATGVKGENTANVGTTYGVHGSVTSLSGFAGYFTGGRNYFEGNVGIGIDSPSHRLDIHDSTLAATVMNLRRNNNSANNSDMLQIVMGSESSDTSQFIECERGVDVKFRVWGDGDVSADGTFSSPADFAEMIKVTTGAASVEPGDVVEIDVNNPRSVVKSTKPRSCLVVGVYSTKPGVLGSEHDWDEVARNLDPAADPDFASTNMKPIELGRRIDEVPVAVVGIVPCKVSAENGPIRPGDALITSSTPGHAMRDDDPKVTTVVGKALGSLDSGTGVIRVLITLQ